MTKFSSFLVVLLLMSVSFTAHAQGYPRGDVDRDGAVTISDVTCLIDNLLKGVPEGDVDQDGLINISDVTSLMDYLLKGSWSDDPVTPPTEGDWVDLGLPSGTIWATRNIGASAPEDYGDYFAWGETTPKDYYDQTTYKWWQASYYDANGNWHSSSVTKYCTDSSYGYNGFVDNKSELDPEDDAAYVNWGPSWRMPSSEQIWELIDNCTWQWTQRNGVNGQLGTGPNGNTIFLPAAGERWEESFDHVGSYGNCWSRTLGSNSPKDAYYLHFRPRRVPWLNDDCLRYGGFTVRAVRVSQN